MKTLGAYMILKNEEKCIKNCIDSIIGICDEIVIADTGCDDNTIPILLSYNSRKIKIYNYEWENDFSKARNFIMSKVESDYCFTTDADETFTEDLQHEILFLKDHEFNNATNIELYLLNYNAENGGDYYLGGRQIVKNSKDLAWRYKIHEKLYYDESNKIIIPHEKGYILHKKESNNATSNYNKYAEIYFDEINKGNLDKSDKTAHFFYYLFFTLYYIDDFASKRYLYQCYNTDKIISSSEDQRLNLYKDNWISYEQFYMMSMVGQQSMDTSLASGLAIEWGDYIADYIGLEYIWNNRYNEKFSKNLESALSSFAYVSYQMGYMRQFAVVNEELYRRFPSSEIAIHNNEFIYTYLQPFWRKYDLVIISKDWHRLPSLMYYLSKYFTMATIVTDDEELIKKNLSLPFIETFFVKSDYSAVKRADKCYFIVEDTNFKRDELKEYIEDIMFNKPLNTDKICLV